MLGISFLKTSFFWSQTFFLIYFVTVKEAWPQDKENSSTIQTPRGTSLQHHAGEVKRMQVATPAFLSSS